MKKKSVFNLITISISILITVIAFSCTVFPKKNLTVSVDSKFKNQFYADSNGITGADGLFSIPLSDGSSLFLVGDCFLGKVVNNSRDTLTKMLRNAGNIISRDKSTAQPVIKGTISNPITLMEPVNLKGDSTYRWYWPCHGFVKNDTVNIFALSLYTGKTAITSQKEKDTGKNEKDNNTDEIFSFRVSHIDLLSYSYPDFRHLETHKVEIDYPANQIDFGNCIMIDSGYVYIYGTSSIWGYGKLNVARAPLSNHVFYKDWNFFTGTGWDKDISKAKPLEIDISVSEQFSIFSYKNKYVLLTQDRGGSDIYTFTSDYPCKGFHNKKLIYHTKETESDPNKRIFTYNALAHPQYIKDGQLLVSYCVNSLAIRDVYTNVESYRANFLRVPMKLIMSEANTK